MGSVTQVVEEDRKVSVGRLIMQRVRQLDFERDCWMTGFV